MIPSQQSLPISDTDSLSSEISPRDPQPLNQINSYNIQHNNINRTTTGNSSLSTSSSRLSRQSSNFSELSRIITGIKDDQQLIGNLRYTKSTEPDYILANELDRVASRITSRRQSISLDTPHPQPSSSSITSGDVIRKRRNKQSKRRPSEIEDILEDRDHEVDGEKPAQPPQSSPASSSPSPSQPSHIEPEESVEDEKESEGKYKADGLMAWITAICAMMNIFATWGGNAAFGVFLNFYLSNDTFRGATKYDYALVGGIIVFLANVLSPISALLYKIFGFRTICLIGVVFQTAGWILASVSTKLWQIYLTQGVLVGVSFLLIFIPSTLVVPTWFIKQKAASMGLTMSGTGLGGLVFSLSVNKVIQDTGDQKWALRMVGLVALFLVLTSATIMKPRNYKQPPLKTTLTKEFIIENAKVIFDLKVVKNQGVCIIALWFTLVIIGYTLMMFSLSSYATAVGLSHSQASTLTAIMNAAQTVGRPCMGFLADYVGRANFATIGSLVISILLYAYWINADTFGSLIGFAICIGLVIGLGASLVQPLIADVISPNLEQMPAAWSAINIFMSFFSLVTEVIALALVVEGSKNPYLHTQIFAGTCYIACFLIVLTLREFLIRKSLHERLNIMEIKLARFTGTTKSGYLKLEDHCDPEEDLNPEDEALLRERVARYHYLLRGNVHSYFIRMFYPVRI